MKELSIEEKAKAYDEAIERAKEQAIDGYLDAVAIDDIFPELAISEDERIRKAMIDFFKHEREEGITVLHYGVNIECMIAWLEKQGENPITLPKWKYKKDNAPLLRDSLILNKYGCVAKSPSGALVSNVWVIDYDELAKLPKEELEKKDEQKPDKVEPKFKVGVWVVWDNKISCHVDNIYQGKNSLMYTITDTNNMIRSYSVKGFDNNAHLWAIDDAKDGDVLATFAGAFIYNGNNGGGSCPGSYCGIDTLGRFKTGVEHHWSVKKVYPATKEQRDLLFQKMKEAGYKWDADKKELRKIEQKPAWSEEDKRMFESVLWHLRNSVNNGDTEHSAGQLEIWLKSLKGRVLPQPKQEWSEEDERIRQDIEDLIRFALEDGSAVSPAAKTTKEDVLDWLKSLRPQPQWKPSDKQMEYLAKAITTLGNEGDNKTSAILYELRTDLKKLKG